jgi:hypothetical protein
MVTQLLPAGHAAVQTKFLGSKAIWRGYQVSVGLTSCPVIFVASFSFQQQTLAVRHSSLFFVCVTDIQYI